MVFTVSFFFAVCLVLSVTFQGECNQDDNGKAIAPRFKRNTDSAMFDLEKQITTRLTAIYMGKERKLEWIVMNGSHPEIAGKADLAKSVVNVEAKNVNPGEPTQPHEKLSGLFTNLYCNNQDMPLSSTIKQTVKRNSTFTYRAKKGLKRFNENGIPFELPLPASLHSVNVSVPTLKINLMGKKSEAQSVMDPHELNREFKVEPHKAIKVTITLVYNVVYQPFEADLVITGAVVAKSTGKDGSAEYESLPVNIFGDSIFEQDGDSLIFKTNGQFTASRAIRVDVKEEPMSADKPECKHEELQSSQGDFRIIHLKPTGPQTEDLTSRK